MDNIEYVELKLNFELDKPSPNGHIYNFDDIISQMQHKIENNTLFVQLPDDNEVLQYLDPIKYDKYTSMVHLKDCIGVVQNLYKQGSSLIFNIRLITFRKELTKEFIESGDFSVTLYGRGRVKNNIVFDYIFIKLVLINNKDTENIL